MGSPIKHRIKPRLGEHQPNNPKLVYTMDFRDSHMLRHTYITNPLIYKGVDPKTVQYLAAMRTADYGGQAWRNYSVVNAAFAALNGTKKISRFRGFTYGFEERKPEKTHEYWTFGDQGQVNTVLKQLVALRSSASDNLQNSIYVQILVLQGFVELSDG